jgi:hypothetical protein
MALNSKMSSAQAEQKFAQHKDLVRRILIDSINVIANDIKVNGRLMNWKNKPSKKRVQTKPEESASIEKMSKKPVANTTEPKVQVKPIQSIVDSTTTSSFTSSSKTVSVDLSKLSVSHHPIIRTEVKYLGVVKTDPEKYMQKYGDVVYPSLITKS